MTFLAQLSRLIRGQRHNLLYTGTLSAIYNAASACIRNVSAYTKLENHDLRERTDVYLAGSAIIFAVYFANVVMRTFANNTLLGDAGEMLAPLAATILRPCINRPASFAVLPT